MHLTNTLFTLSPCHGSCPFVKYINTYPSDSISSRRLVKRINISHKIAGTTQIGPQKTALVFIPGYVPYSIPHIFSCRHEKLFSTVWTPIQYVTLHFRDRSSIEITIVMCDREALYIWYCFRAGVKAIQHGVNITSVCFILLIPTQTWLSLIKGRGRVESRRPGARGQSRGAGAGDQEPVVSLGYLYNEHNLQLLSKKTKREKNTKSILVYCLSQTTWIILVTVLNNDITIRLYRVEK